jgi:UDP-glucuronate 4-epimerase
VCTYLITGVAGFIASKVADLLISAGHTVIGIDNLNHAYDVRLKQWRLAQLQGRAGFTFHLLDIGDRTALGDLFRAHCAASQRGFDAVINLAARAGVRQSVENPWVYYEANVIGTLNLLELCHTFGVPKFLLASTSSLYGQDTPLPFREDVTTDHPLSPYAASKKAAEVLCYTYHHLYNLDVSILRYFTVYGPAGRPDMSPFRFVQWISEGRPVAVYGDGKQTRDFTYVEDIAQGTIAALKLLDYEVINLGSDQPKILTDVIRLIADQVGHEPILQFHPAQTSDMRATWADISKAQRLLGWRPQHSFEEGISQLVSWYKKNRVWASNIITD